MIFKQSIHQGWTDTLVTALFISLYSYDSLALVCKWNGSYC